MNKTYKVVRNGTGHMVVTSELGKTHKKIKSMVVMAAVGLLTASPAFAEKLGGYGGPGIPASASFAGVQSGNGISVKNEGYLVGGDNGGNYFKSVINLSDDVLSKLDKVRELENKVDNLPRLDTSGMVEYDSATTKDQVTFNPGGTTATLLTNVRDGAVAAGSKDAVTGNQLFGVKTTADKAVTDAATAQSTANTANTKADAAKAAAATADAKAVTADGKATAAQTTANTANTKADAAKAAAATADAKAVAADAKAVAADGKATAAQTTANKAVADAAKAQTTANTAVSKADAAQATANTANSKATKNAADIADLQAADAFNVKYDSLTKGKISLGGAGGTTISGVKAGALTATSTEAVNGGQLYATNQQVAANTGNITNLDRRVTITEGDIVSIANGTKGLVLTDGKTTSVDKSGTSTTVALAGANGARTVSGVKAGTLTATSTEAVNGGQLYATNQQVAANTGNITNLDRRVTITEGDIVSIANGTKGLVLTDGKTTSVDKSGTSTTVALAGANGARTVSGVKAGALTATSTEAINGGQLYATNQQVASNTTRITTVEGNLTQLGGKTEALGKSVAANLGGGASYNADTGTVSAPSYTVAGTKHNNVGSAFAAVDGNLTTIRQDITSIIKGEKGLVTTDGQVTSIDKSGSSTVINVAGAQGDRIITGVADGVAANDVATKGQLDRAVASNERRVNDLSDTVETNRKVAAQGVASAMAMSIDYPAQHPGEWAAGAGMGHYDGATSLALGVNYLSQSGKMKVFGAYGQALSGGSKPAGKVGVGFVF